MNKLKKQFKKDFEKSQKVNLSFDVTQLETNQGDMTQLTITGVSDLVGALNQLNLHSVQPIYFDPLTKKLIITFTPPSHANDSFTPASYGTDSFTAASLSSGFYTAGTTGTPTAVTLPTRSENPIKAWTGYTTGVANTYAEAQTFTGTPC